MEEKQSSQENATESVDLIKTTTRRKTRAKTAKAKETAARQSRTEPTKKDLTLYTDPRTHLIRIKFVGGGQLPKELDTAFTKPFHAERAIERYLAKRA